MLMSYFMVDKRICTGREELSTELVNFSEHSLQVVRPHVLSSVDAETSDADTNELIEEVDDLLTHVLRAESQVNQAYNTNIRQQ